MLTISLLTSLLLFLPQDFITYITINKHNGRTMLHTLTYGRNIGTTLCIRFRLGTVLSEVLDANFDGYTVQDAMGSWKSCQRTARSCLSILTTQTYQGLCTTIQRYVSTGSSWSIYYSNTNGVYLT